ncbi:MAG TPA: hypothetical protein VHL11_09310 [Phototrophicaceae bacterium]|jgi:hypothetical protein|nr:hypothetical protein [Phototrophicaceae bacterium]
MKVLFKRSFRTFSIFSLVIVCFTVMSLGLTEGFVPTITESQKVTASGVGDFGETVVIDGDTMLSTQRVINASHIASVYVFVRSGTTWSQQAILTPDAGDSFFQTLALSGNTALVTAVDSTDESLVYVFVRSGMTWSLQTKLLPGDTTSGFGIYGVALDGDTALISSVDLASPTGPFRAAVYPFTRSGSTWTQQTKFNVGSYSNEIYTKLALDGNTAVVSTWYYTSTPGEAHVFNRSGSSWVEQAVLTSSDSGSGQSAFGYSLALDGTNLLIADISAGAENGDGAVYAFKYNGTTWSETQKITNIDASPNFDYEAFGSDIALDGNGAIIGSNMTNKAYTYVYDGTTWQIQTRLIPSFQGLGRWPGSIGVEGTTAVIGAEQGSTFVFVFDDVFASHADQNLLVNGDFELDTDTNGIPDGWSRKNTTADHQVCNQTGQPPVAYSGNCAYLMVGGTTTDRKLVQNVDLFKYHLVAGDRVKLNGFYNKASGGSVQIRLFVSYANLPEDQARVTVTKTTTGYQAIPVPAITLKATPTRVRVEIQNQTTSGQTWFDAMNLHVKANTTMQEVVPLPQLQPLPSQSSFSLPSVLPLSGNTNSFGTAGK